MGERVGCNDTACVFMATIGGALAALVFIGSRASSRVANKGLKARRKVVSFAFNPRKWAV